MEAAHAVDRCIAEIATALPVDMMPGPSDLASHALPQQPLHRCLFPLASQFETFHRVTNPYHFSADGVSFLGTSGQNVQDIRRCVTLTTSRKVAGKVVLVIGGS
jgi:DNA polymerase delta subunit 2